MRLADLNRIPHRRLNPLTGDWVLVSVQRLERPWQGREETTAAPPPRYDPACYLCPSNARAGGGRNPQYQGAFVFDNDYPALLPHEAESQIDEGDRGLMVAHSESGVCRVVCFSPRHDLTVAQMTAGELRSVVDVWVEQSVALATDGFRHVQIFENRGPAMGASNPHPHCQIWATRSIPDLPRRELQMQTEYLQRHRNCLLCEYLRLENGAGERVVCENAAFTALVPFWAVWPFETILIGKRHVGSLAELQPNERDALADILKRLSTRYDNLFEVSFPYSMGFHQQPSDGASHPEWHLHAHFFPPLLRSATVRKHMVGFEMLAEPQRDISPESAAERLRRLSERNYLEPE